MQLDDIGIMALGSHEERHGAALPEDTDAKLATFVAEEAAKRTGAKFIGVLYSSYELPGIDTGRHQSMNEVLDELEIALRNAKRAIGIKAAVLVNGHGGNNPIEEKLPAIEAKLGVRLVMNNTLIDLEGPHAATGELSMGAAIEITNSSKLVEHMDFAKHPEVGFVGLSEARGRYPWAEEQAQEVSKFSVRLSKYLGEKLLECAVADVVNTMREI
ncbi:MAG: 2-amino-5-formylamino-6-ribosylaminopyrimidin-4(3H)-one 5'-monophosphate deformylase [Candidatus Hadarchaeota archaeon]